MALYYNHDDISIHALREEGDLLSLFMAALRKHFYPRPPRGGRLDAKLDKQQAVTISIHALREEGDVSIMFNKPNLEVFLSTPSARRATGSPGKTPETV